MNTHTYNTMYDMMSMRLKFNGFIPFELEYADRYIGGIDPISVEEVIRPSSGIEIKRMKKFSI